MESELRARLSLRNPVHFLALGFGSGLAQKMPGTFGTLAAFPLVAMVAAFGSIYTFVAVTLMVSVVGIWLCGRTAEDMGVHDHGAIVWDEVAGMFIAMLLVPLSWTNLLVAFALFRVFDILKPWPISVLDKKLHGGLGIMLDDVLAGAVACVMMHVLLHFQVL